VPSTLEVPLDSLFDEFGNQFETVQVYDNNDGLGPRVTFGIFDTGASPITYGSEDQFQFEEFGQGIPTLPGVEVGASGVGGDLTGLVSQPGTISADGMHAFDIAGLLDFEGDGGLGVDLSHAASVDGVQAMIGTTEGSPDLTTITGTPILNGRLPGSQTDGVAALIDSESYQIDFGELFPELPEFQGLIIPMPDLTFVQPGTQLVQGPDTTEVAHVPVDFLGIDNHLDPGDTITESYNPSVTGISVHNTVNNEAHQVDGQRFLFDTGAQLSIISSALADQMGLDLDHPDVTIDVGGAGGSLTVGGYTIESLTLPRDDNNDGIIDGELIFTDVPVFVLDLDPSFDGILGMNLFNYAAQMLYDPWDPDGAGPGGPSLQFTFSTADRDLEDPGDLSVLNQLFPQFAASLSGSAVPRFNLNTMPDVAADQAAVTTPEGQPATNAGIFADADGDGVTISADVGSVTQTGRSSGTWSWSLPTTDGPAGPFTVTITATDAGGGSKTTTFTYSVTDVAPTIALTGNAQVSKNAPYTLELGAITDPGTDTVAGYRVNWGDGTSTGLIDGTPTGTLQHTYTTGGSQTITVDLADDSGMHLAGGTKTITVFATAPNLVVTQSAPPAAFVRGRLATFRIKILNAGDAPATGAFVNVVLPNGLTYVTAGRSLGWDMLDAHHLRMELGTLDPGQRVTLVLKARVAGFLPPVTMPTTTAMVGDDGLNGPDSDLANNSFSITRRIRR